MAKHDTAPCWFELGFVRPVWRVGDAVVRRYPNEGHVARHRRLVGFATLHWHDKVGEFNVPDQTLRQASGHQSHHLGH